MQKTRLIQFLSSLSQAEFKILKDFVSSPVYNKNKYIISLFAQLEMYFPDFDDPDLTEENLFRNIFSDAGYDYYKMKNLVSDLLSLGKDFLVFQSLKTRYDIRDSLLLPDLEKRNLDKIFEQSFKSAASRLEKSKVKDENYLIHKFTLAKELTNFYSPRKPNENHHFQQEKLNLFVNYSVIMLLKTYNIMLHEINQNNFNYDMRMFEQVMTYIENNPGETNPTIKVYHQIIKLCLEKSEENYLKLKHLREEYNNDLNAADRYMLFLHLDSYCATAYNIDGRTDLLYDQYLLSRECNMNNFPELGKILYPDFLNDIKKAVRVNEFDFAMKYIEDFRHNLTEEKENTLNFCYGYIAYKKGNLDEALDLFSKTGFSNYLMKVQVKLLLIQLVFDKQFYDQVFLMIDSYRHYISREKMITEVLKNTLFNFLRIIGDLAKLRTSADKNDKEKISRILFEINNLNSNHFGMKLWLAEKIQEN
ncbi:MAG: hypothetical protein JSS91_02120 [Bacteroidetes bacterium]|nr:hypothetical protein [Bacteroidota bacterium]